MTRRSVRIANKSRGHIYGAKWEGVPVQARVVRVIVGPAPAKDWWSANLVGQSRLAVEVTLGIKTFYLDNEDGNAVWKLTKGRGSVIYGHLVVPVDRLIDDPSIAVFYK